MDCGGAYACARNSRPRPVVAFESQVIVCFVGCCRGYSSVQPSITWGRRSLSGFGCLAL